MIYFDHGVQKWRKRKRSKLSEKKMNMAISSHIPLGPRRMLQGISKISGKFRFIFESIRPAINIRGRPDEQSYDHPEWDPCLDRTL